MLNLKKLVILFCCMQGVVVHDIKASLEKEKSMNNVYAVHDIFKKRRSPRALSGEMLSHEELMTVFEAARLAPSASNEQPWRFLYANRGDQNWELFFNFLVPFNQSWCHKASTLVVIISHKVNNQGEPSATHSFDTGAAWENLALQAASLGLVAHGMGGFDHAKVREELEIPDDYAIQAMIALGKPGDIKDLPAELQKIEKPSERKPLEAIVFVGKFKKNLEA